MQEQMRKLVEESHTKKAKKNKKKDFTENARATSQTKKKKPAGEVKPAVTDSVSASISNVVGRFFGYLVKQRLKIERDEGGVMMTSAGAEMLKKNGILGGFFLQRL